MQNRPIDFTPSISAAIFVYVQIGHNIPAYKDNDLIDYANLRLALFGFAAVYSDSIPKTLAEIFQIVFRESKGFKSEECVVR